MAHLSVKGAFAADLMYVRRDWVRQVLVLCAWDCCLVWQACPPRAQSAQH